MVQSGSKYTKLPQSGRKSMFPLGKNNTWWEKVVDFRTKVGNVWEFCKGTNMSACVLVGVWCAHVFEKI